MPRSPDAAGAPAPSIDPVVRRLLLARALRGFADGFVAVLLPAYLLALGLGQLEVGFISSATLAGSALATLAVGTIGHRWPLPRLLRAAALLMAATGLAFAGLASFWPLLLVAFVGTLNPSSGDVSVFLPLEHARLAGAASGHARTALYARYTLAGSLSAAVGALAAGIPPWLGAHAGVPLETGMRAMFAVYGAVGLIVWAIYRSLPAPRSGVEEPAAPLGASRRVVVRLAGLFSLDAFAGGLVVQALLALWLFERFGLSLGQASLFFFVTGLLSAASQLAAPVVARRFGLLNTMVWTHIPANLCLVAAALSPSLPLALTFLFVRSALSQMDVPTRTAFVMALVTPGERAAAASFTAVPRSLASAASPALAGAWMAAGWLAAPLVVSGLLKVGYDIALLLAFRGVRLPEDE
ncbi:MAG: MFS transporter [Caldimonas sp.]